MSDDLELLHDKIRQMRLVLESIEELLPRLRINATEVAESFDDWKSRAMSIYDRWRTTRLPPSDNDQVEVEAMAMAGVSQVASGEVRRVRLRKQPSGGQFVRLSPVGSDRALILPNPDVHLEPAHAHLFPSLFPGGPDLDSEDGRVEPIAARRIDHELWEVE